VENNNPRSHNNNQQFLGKEGQEKGTRLLLSQSLGNKSIQARGKRQEAGRQAGRQSSVVFFCLIRNRKRACKVALIFS
jgi:hypothetical protein